MLAFAKGFLENQVSPGNSCLHSVIPHANILISRTSQSVWLYMSHKFYLELLQKDLFEVSCTSVVLDACHCFGIDIVMLFAVLPAPRNISTK